MADNKEIGRIGQRRYGGVIYEEFLHELRGKRGIEAYREMSENDDVVGAILFAIEMLVRQTDWNVEPGGDSQADIDAANKLIEHLGLHSIEINIKDAVTAVMDGVEENLEVVTDQTKINLPARIRMATLYAVSQSVNGLSLIHI